MEGSPAAGCIFIAASRGLSTAPAGAKTPAFMQWPFRRGCSPACGSSYVLGWVVNENIYSLVNASVLILEVIERGSGVQSVYNPGCKRMVL